MIVRNESAILERCLLSVLPYIDCYAVCDTGSTDDTIEIIRRVLKSLPGEVHTTVFEDFEQARNEALEAARASSLEFDYLLLIDADMELVVTDPNWREGLVHPAYLVRQVTGGMAYQNVRLVARAAEASYVGRTHEYLALKAQPRPLEAIHMLDHACGSSRSEKTERDLALLRSAVEENSQDSRSYFYLAQTLREAGRYDEAIEAYQHRVALGGWDEEVWFSRFMIARCHQAKGDTLKFVAGCLEAYDLRPTRAEPLHALAQHYRNEGLHEACVLFCEAGLEMEIPNDQLFVQEDVYLTGLRYEYSIGGYYSKLSEHRKTARQFCQELATGREVALSIRESARSNWYYYALRASELFPSARFVVLETPTPPGFNPCNPSVAIRDGSVWCVVRCVNYRLRGHEYVIHDGGPIRTQNYLLGLDEALQVCSSVPITYEDRDQIECEEVKGLEDIRLFYDGTMLRGSATICAPDLQRRMAIFDLADDGRVERLSLQEHEAEQHQKNWVPFVDDDRIGFVYWTDPTTVLLWDKESRQAAPWLRQKCPLALENQRGSSAAIPFDDGWLYVTHEVVFAGTVRTYLHRFVQLDGSFRVVALTEPFYFRNLGVEFCCGLCPGPREGQLLASFGVEDCEAWLVVLEIDDVRAQLQEARPLAESA